ncbi:Cation channel sperm-associated protein 3 [Orchesella cincta]|uniref:Cation channel sperm-associated protein 3 n=1 Tax=Orchesella cincta TaxID=48709 RepID=A0A1D2NKN5_ORCCI|nr:Cation channel sperm-associated protein 3 [Orchesella cincta]
MTTPPRPSGNKGQIKKISDLTKAVNKEDGGKDRLTLGLILSLATGAIGKWQRNLTEDRRLKIKKLFTVPRNDPEDPFKPNSERQVKLMSELPFRQPLPPLEEDMLQTVAVNYDFCLPLDIVEWTRPIKEISNECREQLEKLPTWLKALVMLRYDSIYDYFGNRTQYFLRMLANRIDFQRTIPMKIFDIDEDEDEEDFYTINKNFVITEEDFNAPILEPKRKQKSISGADLWKVAHAIALWKLPKNAKSEWTANMVHRSAGALRRAMLTQATPGEIAMVAEDEKADVLSDESEEENLYKPPSWQEIVSERPEFKEEIRKDVAMEFHQVPKEFYKLREDVAPKIQRRREDRKKREREEKVMKKQQTQKQDWWKRNKIYASRKARQSKKEELITRGLYRRYSRIWYKNCPMEEIAPTKRRAHHYRPDECFHAYVVALVGSHLFKNFIMAVIVANAIILAIETGEIDEDAKYVAVFEILDNLFLSIYLTEFMLKIYAHPQGFWRGGFNVFDFIILVISLIKAITGWLSLAEVPILRVLIIVRALRILRGVSLSIQIQVLVTALVETLKTHVLSVLILLLLLMYISAIIAYYMFGDTIPNSWGNIGNGMLNLFAFVTMDGWTTMVDTFKEKNYIHSGRIFCLVGIVLGNFVFSNIFIAIIIMQISEATEAFRNKQTDEREAVVARKKETVFRRQKLDMRQLLARQKLSISADFYFLASQFQRLLRHDDLVDMHDMVFSPMWIDCLNKSSQRCLHTSNLLMNIHRQVADHLLEIYELYHKNKPTVLPIRRARYNRCVRMKAKLSLLKNEFYRYAVARTGEDPAARKLRLKPPAEWNETSFVEKSPSKKTPSQ